MTDEVRDWLVMIGGLVFTAAVAYSPGRQIRARPMWPQPVWRQVRAVCDPSGDCRVETLEGYQRSPKFMAAQLAARLRKEKGWTIAHGRADRIYATQGLGPGAPRYALEPWSTSGPVKARHVTGRVVPTVLSFVRPATPAETAMIRLRPVLRF